MKEKTAWAKEKTSSRSEKGKWGVGGKRARRSKGKVGEHL